VLVGDSMNCNISPMTSNISIRLVPTAGVIARTVGNSGRSSRRGKARGRQGLRLPEAGGSVRVGAGPVGTAFRWGRRAVVRCHILIGPFKFKFNRLNMNLTV
jgi:hypothetical protein